MRSLIAFKLTHTQYISFLSPPTFSDCARRYSRRALFDEFFGLVLDFFLYVGEYVVCHFLHPPWEVLFFEHMYILFERRLGLFFGAGLLLYAMLV